VSAPRRKPPLGQAPVDTDDAVVEVLVKAALEARGHAYAPYSRYRVGAAILTKSGKVFVGCNVENASYGATICAERSAICAMVAQGEGSAIACVVATSGKEPGSPCGICRQVLAEFATDMRVVLVSEGPRRALVRRETTLKDLLPDAFRLESLGDVSPLRARPGRRPRSGGAAHRRETTDPNWRRRRRTP
jgi:cytidine deaminase